MPDAAAPFIHLHVHSYYSFLDSALSPADIVAAAKEAGAHAVAITDTNCLSGAIAFIKAATDASIHPIIGAEIRQPLDIERTLLRNRNNVGGIPPLMDDDDDADDESCSAEAGTCSASHPLAKHAATANSREFQSMSPALCQGDPAHRTVLLARNFQGYSEISRIATRRMLDSEFDIYRELRHLSPNVIVLSDCIDVLETLAALPPHTAPDSYAILIPSRQRRRQNRTIYDTARRLGLPLVVTCDVKLATPDDVSFHTMLQAMRRLATVDHITPAEKIDPAQHFQSADAVRTFFGIDNSTDHADTRVLHEAIAAAMDSTAHIARQCQCKLPLGEWKFPRLPGANVSPTQLLRDLVWNGLAWRYGNPLPDDVTKRADYELSVIDGNHFTDYFLLVHSIVAQARRRDFFIIGRGSAANSIVTYALGISNVCPIKHNLYFERFLNPERSVPPDIDIDFSWKERDEIIQWCFEHFGQDHVALISTIQTFRSRQSIREVAKAYGVSEGEVNQFTRLAETGFRMEESYSDNGNGRRPRSKVHDLSKEEPWRTILAHARRLHGFPRHFSVHCGGIVITPSPVTDWVPLTRSAKGYAVTQYDMYSAEDLGLIKIDLLGNRSLGVLKDAITQAEEHRVERLRSQRQLEQQNGHDAALPVATTSAATGRTAVNTATFQREAVRMKLAGTRRGTTVALAGVLQNFSDGEIPAETFCPDSPVGVQVFDFARVTSDPDTRAMIDGGRTMGCFYIESPGMRALFERLRCKSYEEVVAASSIIRPGVAESGMMQEYIDRHKNVRSSKRKSAPVVLPLMYDVLPETHGVMVYQEDVLRVAHEVAGLSFGQADLLRRAMSGKHRSEDGIRRLEGQFMSGAAARGISPEDAGEIWRQISSFAGYSFCKGHSAAFAVLSYQIAYLKAHYPAEFFAALLTNQGGFYGAAAYQQEARRWGVTVHGPCVNQSEGDYTGVTTSPDYPHTCSSLPPSAPTCSCSNPNRPDSYLVTSKETIPTSPRTRSHSIGHLRVGLLALQNLSVRTREIIITERRRGGLYRSLSDFLRRTGIGAEECRTLIKAGALDSLAADSNDAATGWESVARLRPALLLKLAASLKQDTRGSSESLFDDDAFGSSFPATRKSARSASSPLAPAPFTLQELCGYEMEALGFPISAHPLDLVQLPSGLVAGSDIRKHNKKRIRMAGLCIAAKLLSTRNSGKTMKMLTMEDRTDTFEAVMFPRVYERFAPRTLGRGPYLLEGVVDMTLGSPTLNVEKIENLVR